MPYTTRYLTVTETARKLGVSPSTVWRWIDKLMLPAERVGSRKIRIREEDLALVIRPARSDADESPQSAQPSRVVERPDTEEIARRQQVFNELMELRRQLAALPITATEALAIVDAEQLEHDERLAGIRR
jgi:excisionase family DNA binding protein